MSEWRPIESAPVHGAVLIADKKRPTRLARAQKNGHGEWEVLDMDGVLAGYGFYPTHWMPLPQPPEASSV